MKAVRIVVGLTVWAFLAFALWAVAVERPARRAVISTTTSSTSSAAWPASGANTKRLAADLWTFFTGAYPSAQLQFEEPTLVGIGDPVFVKQQQGGFRQVGEVRELYFEDERGPTQRRENRSALREAYVKKCQVLFYPIAPRRSDESQITYHQTPQSMNWVLQTMLPVEKKRAIAREIKIAFEEHHDEILKELRPLVDASLRDAFLVIEKDLPAALSKRKKRFEKLGVRYQGEIVEREIVPLVKKEIWPIVRRYAEPAANEIGMEMWDRASLWSFAWRYTADKLPFIGNKNLLEKEWRRFVHEEAIPMLEDRTGEFINIQKQILIDTARNKKVQQAVRRNFSKMVDDPVLRGLVWEVIDEVMIQNPRLHEVLDKHWRGPQAQHAFYIAGERLEPTIRRIGDLLLGTPEAGISSEFAVVLRNQILGKDQRWFVLDAAPEGHTGHTLPHRDGEKQVYQVRLGGDWRDNPFAQR